MFRRSGIIVVAVSVASAPACTQVHTATHLDDDPVRQIEHWQGFRARPLADRAVAACPDLVDYARAYDATYGVRADPRAARDGASSLDALRAALADLPPAVTRLVEHKLVAVCLVEGLGASGFTETVLGADRQEVGAFVLVDAASTSRTANEWMTWRERSAFRHEVGLTITATIEPPAGDNRQNALRFLLLHELGHVAQVGERFNPGWHESSDRSQTMRYTYLPLSWRAGGHRYQSRFDGGFALRHLVTYYGAESARLPGALAVAAYEQLGTTDFTTLYGATTPFEDFAEAFALFAHTQLSRRQYLVALARGGEVVLRHTACWQSPRCADKRRFFERLFLMGEPRGAGASAP